MESINGDGVIAQARDLVEDYVKAEIISVAEPSTGITLAAVRHGNDIRVLPPSTFDPYRPQPLFRTRPAVPPSVDSPHQAITPGPGCQSGGFAQPNPPQPKKKEYFFFGGV